MDLFLFFLLFFNLSSLNVGLYPPKCSVKPVLSSYLLDVMCPHVFPFHKEHF